VIVHAKRKGRHIKVGEDKNGGRGIAFLGLARTTAQYGIITGYIPLWVEITVQAEIPGCPVKSVM